MKPHIAWAGGSPLCGAGEFTAHGGICPESLMVRSDLCPKCARIHFAPDLTNADMQEMHAVGLMDLAEAIVGSVRGAHSPMTRAQIRHVCGYLAYRLHTWTPSVSEDLEDYDNAAADRVLAAIALVGAEKGVADE